MKYSIDVISTMNNEHYWELLGPNRKRMARSNKYGDKCSCTATARKLAKDLNRNYSEIRFIDLNEGEA